MLHNLNPLTFMDDPTQLYKLHVGLHVSLHTMDMNGGMEVSPRLNLARVDTTGPRSADELVPGVNLSVSSRERAGWFARQANELPNLVPSIY